MAIVRCKICSKEFYIKPNHLQKGWGKYCSISCRSKAQLKGKLVKCFICNKEIYRSPKNLTKSISGKYFCSKSCQTLWRNSQYIGDKSRNWKNGEQSYRNILKRSGKKPICSLCNMNNEKVLVVHHIDHIRTNNNIDNLTWVCLNCHYLIHHDKELYISNKNII